jgi:hypothetical protein
MQGVLRCVASALGQSCAIDFYSSKANTALQWAQGEAATTFCRRSMFEALDFKLSHSAKASKAY